MILNIVNLKKTILLYILILSIGCKNESDLAMERGIQYFELNQTEDAVLEFKHVVHGLSSRTKKLNYGEIKLLSRAHHNLAVAYAKKKWYNDAADEARKAFELLPSNDNRKVMELIQEKNLPIR